MAGAKAASDVDREEGHRRRCCFLAGSKLCWRCRCGCCPRNRASAFVPGGISRLAGESNLPHQVILRSCRVAGVLQLDRGGASGETGGTKDWGVANELLGFWSTTSARSTTVKL